MTAEKKWVLAQVGSLALGIGLAAENVFATEPLYWLFVLPYAVVSNVIAFREPAPMQEIHCKKPLTK